MGPYYDVANTHPLAQQEAAWHRDPAFGTMLPSAPRLQGEGYLTLVNVLLMVLILA